MQDYYNFDVQINVFGPDSLKVAQQYDENLVDFEIFSSYPILNEENVFKYEHTGLISLKIGKLRSSQSELETELNKIICEDSPGRDDYEFCKTTITSILNEDINYKTTIFSKLDFSTIQKDLDETFQEAPSSENFPENSWKDQTVNLEQDCFVNTKFDHNILYYIIYTVITHNSHTRIVKLTQIVTIWARKALPVWGTAS